MAKKVSLLLLVFFMSLFVLLIATKSSVAEEATGCWDCDYSNLHRPGGGGFVLCQLGYGEFHHCSTPERDWCMLLDEC